MPRDAQLVVDGQDVVADVHAVLDKHERVLEPECGRASGRASPGRRIRNVVNIGIGGSDLGPAMAYDALRDFTNRDLTCRFVSNVDGNDVWEATHDLDAAETLFIVSSKTFTTIETITQRDVGAGVARRPSR